MWISRTRPNLAVSEILKNEQLSVNTTRKSTIVEDLSSVSSLIPTAINSATGSLFEGDKQRAFQGKRMTLTPHKPREEEEPSSCSHWGVVTTIFEPSEAIARAAALPGWCLVIVADTTTPKTYMETLQGMLQNRTGNPQNVANVVYLNVQDQKKMEQQDTRTGALIRAIPYGHFSRKNIGYLYAIQQGAKLIFDFDNDNVLNPMTPDGKKITSPLPNNNDKFLENARMAVVGNKRVLNHHPLMGASLPTSWARGFPPSLSLIQDTTTHGFVAYQTNDTEANLENLAVLQFCANHDPDIDAIHRLTQPLPMTFSASSPLIIPTHQAFVPYNAQATIHTQQAHWALLLPFTVPGRVSDIWRGYFAQALFRSLDTPLNMAFLPPSVTQYRNSHDYLADAKAELDLYFKTDKLLELLDNWRCSACTSNTSIATQTRNCLAFCMEELWVELYERQYIEVEDVHMVQLWLSALMENGYNFPAMKEATKKIRDDVVLMGQFNFADSSVRDVLFWNQKWRQWFNRTVVRGPFHAQALQDLRAHGIDAFQGQEDSGRVSPMKNLMRTVKQHQDTKGIAGVLYAHDDAIFNVPSLFQDFATSQQHHMLATFDVRDPRKPENAGHADIVNKLSYKIIPQPDGELSFLKQNGFRTNDANQLVGSLLNWYSNPECLDSLSNVTKDPRSKRYRDPMDGSFMVPVKGQSDFFYVPISLAEPFRDAAQLLLDHNVFLECAFPTLADMLQHRTDPSVDGVAAIRHARLCTNWDRNIRGTMGMLNACGPREQVEVLHPIKMKQFGYKAWGKVVNLIGEGKT